MALDEQTDVEELETVDAESEPLEEVAETETDEAEEVDGGGVEAEEEEADAGEPEEADVFEVEIATEDADGDNTVMRDLRKALKEAKRRTKELEEAQAVKVIEAELGPRPRLDDEDIGYDEELLAERLLLWGARKAEHDKKAEVQKAQVEELNAAYQKKLDGYNAAKQKLEAVDFDDAESVVKDMFTPNRQAFMVKSLKDPAAFIYGLGKQSDRAKALAAIPDDVDFIAAIVRLETTMKVAAKPKPTPEKRVAGAAPIGSGKTLEKLKAAADKSGDFTAYFAEKRKMKDK